MADIRKVRITEAKGVRKRPQPSDGPRANLCDPERDVNGYRFTCGHKADGVTTHPCTGSEWLDYGKIVCFCECHLSAQDGQIRPLKENS